MPRPHGLSGPDSTGPAQDRRRTELDKQPGIHNTVPVDRGLNESIRRDMRMVYISIALTVGLICIVSYLRAIHIALEKLLDSASDRDRPS